MAESVSKITYILEAAQAKAEADVLSGKLSGVGKAAAIGAGGATAAMNSTAAASKAATVNSAQLDQVYQNVVRTQGAGSAAAQQLAAALGISTTATKVATVAAAGAAIASETVAVSATVEAAAVDKSTSAFGRKTSMINTGQGPLRGYDALVQALARSIGGIPLAVAIAIPIILALAQAFLKAGKAKRELIDINEEGLRMDTVSIDMATHNARVTNDLVQMILRLRDARGNLEKATKNEQQAIGDLIGASNREAEMKRRGVELSFQAAATARLLGFAYENLSTAQQKATAETAKAGVEIRKTKEELIRFAAENNRTNESVITAARVVGIYGKELEALARDLNAGAVEQERFNLAINKLRVPRFDESGTTAGIQAQIQAIKTGLQSAAVDGVKGLDNTVRFLRPTLSGLSEDLKHNKEATAALEPEIRKLITRYRELFDTQKKVREVKDIGPQLEIEMLRSSAALAEEDFNLKRDLVVKEFAVRREEMIKSGQATELNLVRLFQIEVNTLQAVTNEQLEHYAKQTEEHRKLLEKREVDEIQSRINIRVGVLREEQRQIAQEKKDLIDFTNFVLGLRNTVANQATLHRIEEETRQRAALSKRFATGVGNIIGLPDAAKINTAIDGLRELGLTAQQVDEFFAGTSVSVDQLNTRIGILAQTNLSAVDTFIQLIDWQQVMTNGIRAFTSAISAAIAGTDNLGRALLVGFLQIIAEIAITLGTLFALAAAGFIALPGFQWTAGQLWAASAALLVFGAVLGGVAAKLGQSNAEKAASSGSAGSATSGAGGAINQGPPNVIIPFPTSGTQGGITINNFKIEGRDVKQFLKGEVISWSNESGGPLQRIKRKKAS